MKHLLNRIQLRLDRAVDSWRLLCCLLTVHDFPDDEAHCTRCDAMRVEHWGHWVVLDG
jgi:hypothetical protein